MLHAKAEFPRIIVPSATRQHERCQHRRRMWLRALNNANRFRARVNVVRRTRERKLSNRMNPHLLGATKDVLYHRDGCVGRVKTIQ